MNRAPMRSLRSRIALAVALIVAVSAAFVGVTTSQLARAALIRPIDQRLEQIATRFPRFRGVPPVSASGRPELGPSGSSGVFGAPMGPSGVSGVSGQGRLVVDPGLNPRPEGRDAAMLQYEGSRLTQSFAAGFSNDEVELPVFDIAAVDALLGAADWKLVDLRSASGDVSYRAVVIRSGSSTTVFALPLTDVDNTVVRLRVVGLAVAIAAMVAGSIAVWWTVRRSLRPLSEIAERSALIGPESLHQRMPVPQWPSEVAVLSTSINTMLDELEHSQRAEREAQASLAQFVADASHELRTPVAAISGHAELAASDMADEATRQRSLQRIQSESARMGRLVGDLLTLAATDTEFRRPHRRVNAAGIVIDAMEDARAVDAQRTYDTDAVDDVHVMGDEAQLTQIVANLLGNVRTHTPAGTVARLGLRRVGDHAVITVSDDGPGIAEDLVPRLFERFTRRAPAGSGGAGLGLAIVAALAEEHGGSVELVDGRPGSTTFEIRLPAV